LLDALCQVPFEGARALELAGERRKVREALLEVIRLLAQRLFAPRSRGRAPPPSGWRARSRAGAPRSAR
jgi:hypothetical protein